MTDSDDAFSKPPSASVLARLKYLVSGRPAARPGPGASAVLDYLQPRDLQDESASDLAEEPISSCDPNREAAMKHIRRLRIRAA